MLHLPANYRSALFSAVEKPSHNKAHKTEISQEITSTGPQTLHIKTIVKVGDNSARLEGMGVHAIQKVRQALNRGNKLWKRKNQISLSRQKSVKQMSNSLMSSQMNGKSVTSTSSIVPSASGTSTICSSLPDAATTTSVYSVRRTCSRGRRKTRNLKLSAPTVAKAQNSRVNSFWPMFHLMRKWNATQIPSAWAFSQTISRRRRARLQVALWMMDAGLPCQALARVPSSGMQIIRPLHLS